MNCSGQRQISAAPVSGHFRPDSHASAREDNYWELAIFGLNWRHRPLNMPQGHPMRTLLFAALLSIMTVPALAQALGTGIPLNQEKEVTPEQAAKRRATEEAYKSTIKSIPDAKPNDPWGTMRSTDTGNAAKAKPAKKSSGNPAN
jgi:hypothetical protein